MKGVDADAGAGGRRRPRKGSTAADDEVDDGKKLERCLHSRRRRRPISRCPRDAVITRDPISSLAYADVTLRPRWPVQPTTTSRPGRSPARPSSRKSLQFHRRSVSQTTSVGLYAHAKSIATTSRVSARYHFDTDSNSALLTSLFFDSQGSLDRETATVEQLIYSVCIACAVQA